MQESFINQIFFQEGVEKTLQKAGEEARRQDKLEGRIFGEINLLIILLNSRFGKLDASILEKLQELSLSQLEELEGFMIDCSSFEDLNTWLKEKILKNQILALRGFLRVYNSIIILRKKYARIC